jgi:ribosomal-protein-alanine N-acetyltransferase
MPPIAITSRLIIRAFQSDEEDAYVHLVEDEQVREHLPIRTTDEHKKSFQDALKENAAGAVFNKWAMINKADGDFIGMCLLRIYNNEPDKLEIGYCLHTKYWGQGIATEMANALIDYALKYPEIKTIVAVTTPGNTASQIVLEKAGLIKQGSIVRNNEELVFFQRVL